MNQVVPSRISAVEVVLVEARSRETFSSLINRVVHNVESELLQATDVRRYDLRTTEWRPPQFLAQLLYCRTDHGSCKSVILLQDDRNKFRPDLAIDLGVNRSPFAVY